MAQQAPIKIGLSGPMTGGSAAMGSSMRDGAKLAVGEWGVAIPVDPGEHVVAASAEGRAPWETRASVREVSGTVAIPLLEPLPAPVDGAAGGARAAEQPLQPSSWWTPMRTTGVVVAGVGVVGLVTAAVLGVVAKSKYDSARAQCSDGPRGCPPSAVSDSDSAYGLATGATVVFVASAVAAAGGAALILFSPSPNATVNVGLGSIGVHGRW